MENLSRKKNSFGKRAVGNIANLESFKLESLHRSWKWPYKDFRSWNILTFMPRSLQLKFPTTRNQNIVLVVSKNTFPSAVAAVNAAELNVDQAISPTDDWRSKLNSGVALFCVHILQLQSSEHDKNISEIMQIMQIDSYGSSWINFRN